ncbi:MAG TPA: type VI secretion system tip protein VgrG [Bryobacteraceae bacterium]
MGPWLEKDRLLLLDTPLGENKLLLHAFSGSEAISEPFHFHLNLRSEDHNIKFDDIVGQKITFGVKLYEDRERYFNGYVRHFAQLSPDERFAVYEAEIVPWLWFLTRAADCRIFQNMTVPDIVRKVFETLGFNDFEFQLSGTYDTWDYCVQYRETAFNFVSRLLEQEGIFYFFRHEKQKHVLVLGDAATVYKPCPGHAKVMYERTQGSGAKAHEDVVLDWRFEHDYRSGKSALTDYNFETPATSLLANIDSSINQGGNSRFELFDFPGEYEKRNQGDTCVKVRMEEEEAVHASASGESTCRGFASGFRFELIGAERRDHNGGYLLTRVKHDAVEGGMYSGQGSGEARYTNWFTAIPSQVLFRPPRVTPKSVIHGAQTAEVVGPSGEEIYCDKYGRVKVQFHWDRLGGKDEKSSCWIRVSHTWAGKGWGAISIPRIGQEVIVDFLEGDPDRPIVTGRVYNALQMPPYTLPAEQTKSTFKTNSSKGGGGFNELRFEDKKGEEQVFIHAQKDQDIRVENDAREWIGRDTSLTVERDRREQVKRDVHIDVSRDVVEQTGRDYHLKVSGKQAVDIGSSYSIKVTGDVVESFSGSASSSAATTYHIKGTTVVIEADAGLTIKCGGSFVTLNAAGVFISGPMVNINTGGAALSAAPGNIVSPIKPLAPDLSDKGAPGWKPKQ